MTADDGAVITVEDDEMPNAWKVQCSVCGYVASDSGRDGRALVEDAAEHHAGWHDAEYAREENRR